MKKVLVVGAAGGVGSALTQLLVAQGYSVMGTVMNEEQASELNAGIPGIGRIAVVELGQADGIAAALGPLIEEAGGLDAAIVCAAISPYGPLETTSLADVRRAFEINAVAGIAIFQATMPWLRRSKGRIILISSFAGKVAFRFLGAYSASKFALEGLADVMRRETRQQGVETILIEPGGIRTPMVSEQARTIVEDRKGLSSEVEALYGHLYEAHELVVTSSTSKLTPPEEVAAVIFEALTAQRPTTRYTVGEDAAYLCNLSRSASDEEIDKFGLLEKDAPEVVR